MQKKTSEFVGQNPLFLAMLETASNLCGRNANVLITGESGTGKELLAKYIHRLEDNPSRPLVVVNCAAIPENLLESELFGYEKGAFTGAVERKIGKFELANGGDIFLDEISALTPTLQAKLLRVLQEKIIYRLGSNVLIKLDFRVIAATNEHIPTLISEGTFREDLFHRVAVVRLNMPSLQKRLDDLPLLCEHFLDKHSHSDENKILSNEVVKQLCNYNWPGNVRELENAIHNLIVMTNGKEIIEVTDLNKFWGGGNNHVELPKVQVLDQADQDLIVQPLSVYLESVKRDYILEVLKRMNWNYTKASRELGINRTTLYKYLGAMKLEEITFEF